MAKGNPQFIIGVDEVGRGPLAGPVAVGAFLATPAVLHPYRGIRDSKQLSPSAREEWALRLRRAMQDDPASLRYAVSFVSAAMIDKVGIQRAIRRALSSALRQLRADPSLCKVLLDGGLHAPPEYEDQRTIIRGDETETAIALASIVAKVARDRRMVRLDKVHKGYGFATHKGYGTALHRAAIKRLGLSPIHRHTFCH